MIKLREQLKLVFANETDGFNKEILVNAEWPIYSNQAFGLFKKVFTENKIEFKSHCYYIGQLGTVCWELRFKKDNSLRCKFLRTERPPFVWNDSMEKAISIGTPSIVNSHSYLVSYLWKATVFNCNAIIDHPINTMRDVKEIEFAIAFDIHKDTNFCAVVQNYTLLSAPQIPASNPEPSEEGHWILEREPDGKPYCLHCSECDSDFSYIGINTAYAYCPLCGIKMNEKEIFLNGYHKI
jgi:hypothetical protein